MAKKEIKDDAKEIKSTSKVAKTTASDVKAEKSAETKNQTKKASSNKADSKVSVMANEKSVKSPAAESNSKNAGSKTSKEEAIDKKAPAKKTNVAAEITTEVAANETSSSNSFLVRYSDEELQMFAGVIQEAKTEALDELRMLKERLEDLTSFDAGEESMIYSMHMAEQGSEAQEKEKTYAQIQRISEHIKKLDDAMDRIRNKSYGICRVCGCLIAKERLLAVPITTLSASYKIHSKCPEDGLDKIEPVKK